MKPVMIEQKRILKLQCYKFVKFQKVDPEKAKCPWDYEQINEMCKNCRWFDIEKVGINGQPVVTDREIFISDVPILAQQYKDFGKVIDVESAEIAMSEEKKRDRA